jgi:hypothetical protein
MRILSVAIAILFLFTAAGFAQSKCPDYKEQAANATATSTEEVVPGSEFDARCFTVVSWGLISSAGAETVTVYGANDEHFHHEVRIMALSTQGGGTEEVELPRNPVNVYYSTDYDTGQWFLRHAPATFAYYRVKLSNGPDGSSGTLWVEIVGKR